MGKQEFENKIRNDLMIFKTKMDFCLIQVVSMSEFLDNFEMKVGEQIGQNSLNHISASVVKEQIFYLFRILKPLRIAAGQVENRLKKLNAFDYRQNHELIELMNIAMSAREKYDRIIRDNADRFQRLGLIKSTMTK